MSKPVAEEIGLPRDAEDHLYSRVTWRLMPLLFLFYVVAYLDRVNVGFAKLQMLSELRWTETVYGTGAGMFFVGYFVLQVPSNLLVYKLGARRALAAMMIVWGTLSAGMMWMKTPVAFYVLRFALGLAEAGFFPAIILYLTFWFPKARRARVTAFFWTAIPVSGMVGGPVSGWIMSGFGGTSGLSGWQWLFLLEGLPSVLLGFVVLPVLNDSISATSWLTREEKTILERNVAREHSVQNDIPLTQVLGSGRVWLLALIYFLLVMGLYGISFWLPQLIKNTGVIDAWKIGLLSAIPYAAAVVAMVAIGRHSDRTGERDRHLAFSALAGSVGFVLSGLFGASPVIAMASLTLATAGILSALPLFWSLPTQFLSGKAAATGIALINAVGCLAGFFSPYLVGVIKDVLHSTSDGLYAIAISTIAGAVLVLTQGARFRS